MHTYCKVYGCPYAYMHRYYCYYYRKVCIILLYIYNKVMRIILGRAMGVDWTTTTTRNDLHGYILYNNVSVQIYCSVYCDMEITN